MARQKLSGTIPDAVGIMISLKSLDLRYNILRGPIPQAVGSWTQLRVFGVRGNDLSGSVPHVVGSWTPVSVFVMDNNSRSGPLPHAFGAWSRSEELFLKNNHLLGSIHMLLAPGLNYVFSSWVTTTVKKIDYIHERFFGQSINVQYLAEDYIGIFWRNIFMYRLCKVSLA